MKLFAFVVCLYFKNECVCVFIKKGCVYVNGAIVNIVRPTCNKGMNNPFSRSCWWLYLSLFELFHQEEIWKRKRKEEKKFNHLQRNQERYLCSQCYLLIVYLIFLLKFEIILMDDNLIPGSFIIFTVLMYLLKWIFFSLALIALPHWTHQPILINFILYKIIIIIIVFCLSHPGLCTKIISRVIYLPAGGLFHVITWIDTKLKGWNN